MNPIKATAMTAAAVATLPSNVPCSHSTAARMGPDPCGFAVCAFAGPQTTPLAMPAYAA